MSFDLAKLDEHIERLRKGDTLTENEVKALCEKVRPQHSTTEPCLKHLIEARTSSNIWFDRYLVYSLWTAGFGLFSVNRLLL
jgi:hypothetical protein